VKKTTNDEGRKPWGDAGCVRSRTQTEEQQAFLLELSDALRSLSDPVEIQATASHLIGRHLGVARACYYEHDDAARRGVIHRDYVRAGEISITGVYRVEDFPVLHERARAQTLAVSDAASSPLLGEKERATLPALGIAATIIAPLVKGDRLRGAFVVSDPSPRDWRPDEIALVEAIAERTWEAVERARAEAALRDGEKNYRSLFNAMDQGFAVLELVRDAEGQAVDFRWIMSNHALERLTRLDRNIAIGRLASELFPDDYAWWVRTYAEVVDTQTVKRFERGVALLGRTWELTAFPYGGERCAVLYDDITERKRLDAALRDSEARKTFLLKLSDALRPLREPAEIELAASRVLGEHLGVSRVFYTDIIDEKEAVIQRDWVDGLPSMAGRVPVAAYDPDIALALRHGETLVIADAATDPRLSESSRQAFAAAGVAASIGASLIKGGRWVAVFEAHSTTPRAWAESEIALFHETAERTWAAVERARTEAALHRSESIRRVALESGGMGAWRWDLRERTVTGDPVFMGLFGLPPSSEPLPLAVIAGRIPPEALEQLGAVASAPTPDREFEFEAQLSSGSRTGRWIRARGRASVDDPAVLAGVTMDVTERKRAEQTLSDSEARYRSLFSSIDAGFCVIEVIFDDEQKPLDFRFLEVNPAFESQTGIRNAGGRRVRDIAPQCDEHWFEIYGRVALTGESARFENPTVEFGRFFDVYAFRVGAPEQHRVAVLFNDITERKRNAEQLREVDRRKDEFLAMLGHELRNPLAAIRSATELLKLTAPEDRLLQRAQGVLERQSVHMTRLIDGLLEVSRIARGKIHLDRETLDMRQVIEGAVESRISQIEARGLELEVDVPPQPLWVQGDPVRLTQIVDNLLANAIKFTDIPGAIHVRLHEEAGAAVIRVRDSGVGIRPQMLDRLFEPFQQDTQDIARAAGGLGLGLALAKGLVELHGGSIEAHSAGPQTGAEFVVRVPLTSAPATLPPSKPAAEVKARRILIVEDNPDAGQMLRDVLELLGHDVAVVETAAAALDVLHTRGADIVLCDLGLPVISGYDLVRMIRGDVSLRTIPVVALTGYSQPEDRKRTADANFDDHLTKPVNIEVLNAVLGRLAAR
jgi:signal transduction histidine kinase/GAF domain-containing protein/CheY-like chemotaxis protein